MPCRGPRLVTHRSGRPGPVLGPEQLCPEVQREVPGTEQPDRDTWRISAWFLPSTHRPLLEARLLEENVCGPSCTGRAGRFWERGDRERGRTNPASRSGLCNVIGVSAGLKREESPCSPGGPLGSEQHRPPPRPSSLHQRDLNASAGYVPRLPGGTSLCAPPQGRRAGPRGPPARPPSAPRSPSARATSAARDGPPRPVGASFPPLSSPPPRPLCVVDSCRPFPHWHVRPHERGVFIPLL